jgi:hypothetical protein
MRADTGVGPSIASGSHVCSGTCADFAKAPTSNITQAATSSVSFRPKADSVSSKTVAKSSAPVPSKSRNAPITRPTSPTTLMTNALMPAVVAVLRRYQKEISR